MQIKFPNEIPMNRGVGIRLFSTIRRNFLGITGKDYFGSLGVGRQLFHIEYNEGRIGIPTTVNENKRQKYIYIIFNTLTIGIQKRTIPTAVNRVIHTASSNEINTRVDIECSIIKSDKISGVNGRMLRV